MGDTKVKARRDRASLAYREIREMIVHGRLAPGSRIIETELAGRLGVSRTPVRSALQRLQQEGYILDASNGQQSRPNVSPLTKEDASELFEIIAALEGLAARLAAKLDEQGRTTVIHDLTQVNQELLRASHQERPDKGVLYRLDSEFHHHFVEAGAGPRLLALYDGIKPQADRYVWLYIDALADEIDTSVGEHSAIIEAISAGDCGEAQRAAQANWRNAAKRLGRVIDTLGERGSW